MTVACYNCLAAQSVKEESKRKASRRWTPGPGHPEAQPCTPPGASPGQGLCLSCLGDLCQAWRTMPGKRRKQSLPGPGHKSWLAQIRERKDIPHAPLPRQIECSPWAPRPLSLGGGEHPPLPYPVAPMLPNQGRTVSASPEGSAMKKEKGNPHFLSDSGLRSNHC